jgi:hypothetical protein
MLRRAMFWRSNKYIVITLAGFLLCFLAFHFLFVKVIARKIADKKEELKVVDYDLSEFYGSGGGEKQQVLMDPYIKNIQKLKETKKKNVAELQNKLAIKPEAEFIVDKEEKYPGSYFKKILDRKREVLLKDASVRNIDIPESLGFGEAIPPDSKAQDLLRFLFVKDRMIKIAVNSGIISIDSIEHFDVVRTGPNKGNRFINEYPVKMAFQATLESTMKILYKMRSDSHFLILRNLEISCDNQEVTGKEKKLGIVIDVAGMTFTEVTEEDIKPKPVKKKTPAKKVTPLGI